MEIKDRKQEFAEVSMQWKIQATLVKKKNVFVMGTVKNAENTILNQKGKEAWLAKEITNP